VTSPCTLTNKPKPAYCHRLIEDLPEALKRGWGAQKRQLQTAHRLFAASALMSVVALGLVDWPEKSRLQAQLLAQALGWETLFLLVLATQAGQPLPTAKE
jgi:uncharacterized membrane protein